MSSVFSRKITMSIFSGCFTGDGTPRYQRTGRRQTKRSSIWRSATFSDRMPPPTGVVNGPLMPTRYSRNASTVSSGSQLSKLSFATWPANTSNQAIFFLPPNAFFTAASNTRTLAAQMSGPVPSPRMNGMIGRSGTFSLSVLAIFSPAGGLISLYGIRLPLYRQACRLQSLVAASASRNDLRRTEGHASACLDALRFRPARFGNAAGGLFCLSCWKYGNYGTQKALLMLDEAPSLPYA